MIKCPLCGKAAHARSSFEHSSQTKERYNQCQNINCGATFVSHETFVRFISKPGEVVSVKPHPKEKSKVQLDLA
ncbi:transcriptional regulator [Photorhabdus temperata]|uniref:Transcriptional regulator n=2 Tax=Photorhabdus TaxID=29487 RepID=A0A7X5TLF9_9GAMM|nr:MULTISPECIES: ogr/Delta-like zinc finger family protein [Photorhabdus]ETS31803.1 Ogr/Delta-like zinc finger [Photorhabdus khanii NC19]MCC8422659.1 ogr/Delta-like zinc finger family protein [Photorhabdus thracensis]NHB96364.1 transcriptional regulator [Photorhabdus stackebrandtii]OHV48290.1 transcriptional regulator [Photorhabdus temperata]